GSALSSAVGWSFTTASGTPPTVTGSTPANGSTGVSRSTAVTATFSRAMDSTTLPSGFTLTAAGASSPVAATVTYNSTTNIATLQPSVPLDATTTYTAKVDTTVRATDGTFVASPVTWSFATALCPCTLLAP